MRFILAWWYARLRATDLKILWPACKEHADSLDQARAVFACHAFSDPAWLFLGRTEIIDIIGDLK